MKIIYLLFSFVLFLVCGCTTRKPEKITATFLSDTSKFFPLPSFFKEQIQYVELRSFPLYKITMKDGIRDSSSLSFNQFKMLTGFFTSRDLSVPEIKILYKESVFQDLSTGSITFNYQPTNKGAELQNIDVLLNEATNQVKRVFIRAVYSKGDTTITEQCNWKANKSFQINRSITTISGYTSTELNYINWNEKP